jgi:hypothetical protein
MLVGKHELNLDPWMEVEKARHDRADCQAVPALVRSSGAKRPADRSCDL